MTLFRPQTVFTTSSYGLVTAVVPFLFVFQSVVCSCVQTPLCGNVKCCVSVKRVCGTLSRLCPPRLFKQRLSSSLRWTLSSVSSFTLTFTNALVVMSSCCLYLPWRVTPSLETLLSCPRPPLLRVDGAVLSLCVRELLCLSRIKGCDGRPCAHYSAGDNELDLALIDVV